MGINMIWSESEWWFYGGIALMAAAVLLALICAAAFRISGKRLQDKLEKEYGKRH